MEQASVVPRGNKLVEALNRVSYVLALAAGGFTMFLMLVIVGDVIMRMLGRPIPGALEISEGVLPIAVFLAVAYTEATGGNIRVTMFTDRLSAKKRVAVDVLVYALATGTFALVTWQTSRYAWSAWELGEVAGGVVPFPISPTKFVIALGSFLLTLQFLAGLASRVTALITRKREG